MSIEGLKKIHVGRNVERIRELKGMKQETLASLLGVTQQAVSKIERSADIDESKLKKIAEALGTNPDSIKNFNNEAAINVLSNTLSDNAAIIIYNFNPIEKLLEMAEENKRLCNLLLAEKDKVIAMSEKASEQKDSIIEMYKKLNNAS